MKCPEFESILADYLDGTLSSTERVPLALKGFDHLQFMAEPLTGLLRRTHEMLLSWLKKTARWRLLALRIRYFA